MFCPWCGSSSTLLTFYFLMKGCFIFDFWSSICLVMTRYHNVVLNLLGIGNLVIGLGPQGMTNRCESVSLIWSFFVSLLQCRPPQWHHLIIKSRNKYLVVKRKEEIPAEGHSSSMEGKQQWNIFKPHKVGLRQYRVFSRVWVKMLQYTKPILFAVRFEPIQNEQAQTALQNGIWTGISRTALCVNSGLSQWLRPGFTR